MSLMSLAFEGVLLVLLSVAIFYCWRVDQKLSALKRGQDGVRAASAELVEAVAQAEAAIRGLRASAQDAGRELQSRIDEARQASERLRGGRGF